MTFLPLANPKRQIEPSATTRRAPRTPIRRGVRPRGVHRGHHSTTSVAGARRGAPGRDLWAFAGNSQPDIRAANWGETGGTPHGKEEEIWVSLRNFAFGRSEEHTSE